MDDNLFHTSTEGKVLENPKNSAPEFIFQRTVSPERAPNKPSFITINFKNGDEMTVQLKIYEDKFYVVNYAVNGNTLLANAMATFDGSICGLDQCGASNYTQKVQY